MRIDGQRRSENYEDRGRGSGGGGRGGIPIQALFWVFRLLGVKGTLIAGALFVAGYFLMPTSMKNALFGGDGGGAATGAGTACTAHAAACDFSRVVLGSTEDVWRAEFAAGRLPGATAGEYRNPTLVVYTNAVATGGCGNASSSVGPFYCPADDRLYIDPTFYDVMARTLHAPGDFAQAYVLAHEVGHHVQKLIGSSRRAIPGEDDNQQSVRVELQADCLAGVWGHTAQRSLTITDEDLAEAMNAAHQIGDDTLGNGDRDEFTHGSSAQRKRWFRQGFTSGDARTCDTFGVPRFDAL